MSSIMDRFRRMPQFKNLFAKLDQQVANQNTPSYSLPSAPEYQAPAPGSMPRAEAPAGNNYVPPSSVYYLSSDQQAEMERWRSGGGGAPVQSTVGMPETSVERYSRTSQTGVPEQLLQTTQGSLAKEIHDVRMGFKSPGYDMFGEAKRKARQQPSYKNFLKMVKTKLLDAKLNKKYKAGVDPDTGKPIYVKESPWKVKFKYTPRDTDYSKEIAKISESKVADVKKAIGTLEKNIELAKQYRQPTMENYQTVKSSPPGSTFMVQDPNTGEEVEMTREKLLPMFEENIDAIQSTIQQEQYIPEYKQNVTQMERTRELLTNFQQLGYELDVDPDTGYSFRIPKSSKVYDWYYGTDLLSNIPKVGAGWMEGFFIPSAGAGVQSLIDPKSGAWEAKQEQLAGMGLGYAENINVRADPTKYWMKDVMASDAMITIGTFALTAGGGYALAGAGSRLGGIGAKVALKGGKIAKVGSGLGKVGKAVAKPFSTKLGQYAFGATVFGAMEGPRLYQVYKERPEMLGSEIGKTGLMWGASYLGFKTGTKTYAKWHQPKQAMPGYDVKSKRFTSDRFKSRGIRTQEIVGKQDVILEKVDDLSGKNVDVYDWMVKGEQKIGGFQEKAGKQVKFSESGLYDVSAEGRAIMIKNDLDVLTRQGHLHIPKDTAIISGGGYVVDPVTGKLVKKTVSRPFMTTGVGKELQTPGLIDTKGKIPHIFESVSYTELKSGQKILTAGKGFYESGVKGVATIDTFGRTAGKVKVKPLGKAQTVWFDDQLDLSKIIKTDTEITGGSYIYEGGFMPSKGYEQGVIKIVGSTSIVKPDSILGVSERLILSPYQQATKGIVGSTSATGSLIRQPQALQLTKVISPAESKLGANIAGLVSSNVGSAMAVPIIAPAVGSSISRLSFGAGIAPLIASNIPKSKIEQEQKYFTDTINQVKPASVMDQDLGLIGGVKIKSEFDIAQETERKTIGGTVQELDMNLGQRQDLKMKTALKVESLQMQKPVSISIFAQPGIPVTPTPTPIVPTPLPLFGEDASKKKSKKTRKKKVKRKQQFITEKMHKGLMADLLSVQRSQARYGIATHAKTTEKLWRIGEKKAFTRVPTLEMMDAKKMKKINKRGRKNVYF